MSRAVSHAGRTSLAVRLASREDVEAITAAIGRLLTELGAPLPAPDAMRAATSSLIEDRHAGAVLVAQCGGQLTGLLAASWQQAIHVPGRYALIQDLWVDPDWRSHGVGAALIHSLDVLAGEQGIAIVDVGLPRVSFPDLAATEAFYRANGFIPLGTRMRRVRK
ncbi:MAG: GNAT family N-acetyltransferase [Solirubrobacteraceae bacterium]